MSSNSSATPYGEWNPAGAPFPIRYSHSLLQEIDFFVAEGYRRIPHGGLEVGGLLYGPVEDGALTLVAYRPIECQHSKGPSFALSEFDVETLRAQIHTPFRENEADLPVAGWFVSHCRGELEMTQQEVDLFAEMFPGAHCVTLLVKPERFKATQYGFLARARNGTLPGRRCASTFLLPLTGRPGGPGMAADVAEPPVWQPGSGRSLHASAAEQATAETDVTSTGVSESGTSIPNVALPRYSRGGVWGFRRAPESRTVIPPRRVLPEPERPREGPALNDFAPFAARSYARESAEAAKVEAGLEAEQEEIEDIAPPTFGMQKEDPRGTGLPFALKVGLAAVLVIVLLLAVAWTYLNFMLTPIPLTAETRAGKLVITWPPESTAGANEAWLGTWVDGQASSRLLTPEEQERGEVALERAGADVIVQLHINHLLYERQGMLRWILVPPAHSEPSPAGTRALH
jgi:hypothetical protein